MAWYDWCILVIPVLGVLWTAWYCRRYVRSVADFLCAGRIAGRYVLNVGDIANALSIIGLVGYIEVQYKTGFALTFWNNLMMPLTVAMGLLGYVTYRFRETRAMSFGQFLEMRYGSKRLRIFASFLRSVAEVLTNMIMPAIAARFFIYFLDLPTRLSIFGFVVPTFSLLTILFMAMAISIICFAGTLSLIITDALQGMLLYPLMAIFTIFILSKFSWSQEIVPVMMDRAAGESFLNPYDISKLRDFNLFFFCLTIYNSVMHRGSWIGHATSSAARTPHEQKMAGLLGTWRNALNALFYVVIATMVITLLNHRHFRNDAREIRIDLCTRAAEDAAMGDKALEKKIRDAVQAFPPQDHVIGVDAPLSDKQNLDTVYLDRVHEVMLEHANDSSTDLAVPQANSQFQQFRTLYNQLMISSSMRHILPGGLLGLFALLLVMAMISTDDTRIYSATLTIAQDCVLPFCKKGISPKRHMWIVRWTAIGIGIFFCLGAYFMAQLDYVNLYSTLICIMWNGGCAPVVIFGLYGRFGTKAAAWTSLLTGMFLGLVSVFLQRRWADVVYPFLESRNWVQIGDRILRLCSQPLEPLVHWEMDAVKCPINAYELYAITMLITLILYFLISWLTYREPFNLERMLHRGIYNVDGEMKAQEKWSLATIYRKLLGITPEYTKSDKFLAWFFFLYSFGYLFLIAFVGVVVWNHFSPWPVQLWSHYFLIVNMIIPGVLAVISAFWFGICGVIDLKRLFKDLALRVVNPLDNGQVEGNLSLADVEAMAAVEKQQRKQTSHE